MALNIPDLRSRLEQLLKAHIAGDAWRLIMAAQDINDSQWTYAEVEVAPEQKALPICFISPDGAVYRALTRKSASKRLIGNVQNSAALIKVISRALHDSKNIKGN